MGNQTNKSLSFPGGEIDFERTKTVSFLLRILDYRISRMIFDLLKAKQFMTVTELQSILEIQQPVVSSHLGKMRRFDIVVTKKEGRNVLYSLNVEKVAQINLLVTRMSGLPLQEESDT